MNDGPEGSVVVTGTAVEDGTLSADVSGISDGDGLMACSVINGSGLRWFELEQHLIFDVIELCLVMVMLARGSGSGCLH